jgi:MFS family permease
MMKTIEYRPWLALCSFSLLLFLITASTFSALGVVLPSMVAEEGWNWTQAGFGFTLLGACCGASSFLPALLIRRIGVRSTLLIGTAVMAGGFFCLSITHGLGLYFLGAALCGVGYQMMALIPGTHVLAAAFKRRAMAFGVYFTFGSLGGVAGPLLVLALMKASHEHWRTYWSIQMAVSVAVGLLCAFMIGSSRWLAESSARTEDALTAEAEAPHAGRARIYRSRESWTVREAVRTPQFYILLAAYFGHLLVGITVAALSPAHLVQRGVSATVAGSMLSFESLMGIVGRLGAGLIGDRLDPRYLLIFAFVSMTIGVLALSVADTYPMMLLYAAGTGLGFGIAALAVTVLLINYFGREHNLEIFSVTCLIGALSALGPAIGGWIRDGVGDFTPAFQLFAAMTGIILVAALFMRPPIRRGAAYNEINETSAAKLVEEAA